MCVCVCACACVCVCGAKKYNTVTSSTIIMHARSAGGPNSRNEMEKHDGSEIMNHMITVTSG